MRQQRLALLDPFAGRGDVQLLHITFHARDELPVPLLVRTTTPTARMVRRSGLLSAAA